MPDRKPSIRTVISEDEFRHLIEVKKLYDNEIALLLGVESGSVSLFRRSLGIQSTPRRPRKQLLEEARLRDLYYQQDLSDRDIAKMYGCDKTAIVRLRKKFGVSPKAVSSVPEISGDELRYLFEELRLTDSEISEKFDTAPHRIEKLRNKLGIVRSYTQLSRELLEDQYIEEGLSSRQVAELNHCSDSHVRWSLRRFGMTVRGRKSDVLASKEELVRLYVIQKLTLDAIGEMCDCHAGTVLNRLISFGIDRRSSKIDDDVICIPPSMKRHYREKRNGGKHTKSEWQDKLRSYKSHCAYCLMRNDVLVKEHVVPVVRGEGSGIDNIVPSCVKCNSVKFTDVWTAYGPEAIGL